MKKTYIHNILFLLITLLSFSCTEEINFTTNDYENVLVVDALLTNELKTHEIKLSRTYPLNSELPIAETNASVLIQSNQGDIQFTETEDGIYQSTVEFKAEPNIIYTLKVSTQQGESYTSSPQTLPQINEIEQVYVQKEINDLGESGIAIYVDSFDPTSNSKFYRYEYDETYKIIAPSWVPEEILILEEFFPCTVDLAYRTEEEQICYNTVASNTINLTSTSSLTEDRIQRYLVRFIKDDDYIISHRYSILVKQYIQSQETYSYYETLKNFSEEGSLFTQVQPGFINSNIQSDNNNNEKVLGYFEVSSLSTNRIFFDYQDFYPDQEIPPYPINCIPTEHYQYTESGFCGSLITESLSNRVVYHHGASKILDTLTKDPDDFITIGPFFMVLRACGDCTALGENTIPEFWVE